MDSSTHPSSPTPALEPIYSLHTCDRKYLQKFSSLWWVHVASATSRCLSGFGLWAFAVLYITVPVDGLNELGMLKRKDVSIFLIVLGLASWVAVSGSGVVGFWSLHGVTIRRKPWRYKYDMIGVRLCTLVSILCTCFGLVGYSILHEAFCADTWQTTLGPDPKSSCVYDAYILVAVLCGAIAALACFLLIFLWISVFFKVYTCVSCSRMIFSTITFGLTLDLTFFMNSIKVAYPLDDMVPEARDQFTFLLKLFQVNGILLGLIGIFASSFSLLAAWTRSKMLVSLDILALFISFWVEITCVSSFIWAWTLLDYFRRYTELYGQEHMAATVVTSRIVISRFQWMIVGASLSIISVLTHFIVGVLGLFIECCKPTEWGARERLLVRKGRRHSTHRP